MGTLQTLISTLRSVGWCLAGKTPAGGLMEQNGSGGLGVGGNEQGQQREEDNAFDHGGVDFRRGRSGPGWG